MEEKDYVFYVGNTPGTDNVINYHKIVYDFYKFVLMNILKPSLAFISKQILFLFLFMPR